MTTTTAAPQPDPLTAMILRLPVEVRTARFLRRLSILSTWSACAHSVAERRVLDATLRIVVATACLEGALALLTGSDLTRDQFDRLV